MEFVSSVAGQSLQLMVMDEVRPLRGGPFLPDFSSAIVQRHRFSAAPESFPTDDQQAIKYFRGVLQVGDTTIPIGSLEIYRDGIIVNSRSTEDSDQILQDFITWTKEVLSLREPITHIPRNYQSQIVVSLEKSLNRLIVDFKKLGTLLSKTFGTDAALNVTRLSIGPHPPGNLPFQATWSIEPRQDQPFVSNRYLSIAPLATAQHIELLTQIEAAIG